jgi:hypothetical protein
MQAASLLPHWNTFEARALRVVISDLPAQFSETAIELDVSVVTLAKVVRKPGAGTEKSTVSGTAKLQGFKLTHFVEFTRLVETFHRASFSHDRFRAGQTILASRSILLSKNELADRGLKADPALADEELVEISSAKLKEAAALFGKDVVPANEQIFPNDGFGTLIGKLIYNTVTTFFVGEKVMIQVPTWFFPAGAGPYSENSRVTTHGYPNPQATFRFAEPVMIDTQQNFRVEIEVPEGDVLSELQRLYGPLFIWVTLDGYMTRDVQ